MGRFRAKLNRLELKEMYLNGRKFTWSNERENVTVEKIDHVFMTSDWEDLYPASFLSAVGSVISDHCPLLMDLHADFHMGRRFRFESFWPKAEGFMDTVALAWNSVPSFGNPFVVLDAKLRATAKRLQTWSDRWIGNVKLQITIALEVILRLDVASDSRQLSRGEQDLRRILKRKLLGLCSLERTIARQRSRLLYLKEGDVTTKFFFRHARQRQRRNIITSIKKEGEYLTGHESIAAAVDEYYESIFGSASERAYTINLDALDLPRLELSHLERPFMEDEVEKIVKGMPLDKAPGPDGFTGRFYASCWHIIKTDFMRAMNAFLSWGHAWPGIDKPSLGCSAAKNGWG
ncbi:uncharacterized protein [Aegilops tauschii subsp. strangulata]|uniref:uncharacterized protein n=1 Tax=Aegilops tauschii subsp. strangulata TaxID=200361 RepID=UPI003CC8C8F2